MYSSGASIESCSTGLERAVHLAGDDLRLADGKLEALAPHQLRVPRAAARRAPVPPRCPVVRGKYTERDVADELLVETILEHARGQATAISTDEWRGVDPDRHREARLVDTDDGERARIVRICERLADRHLREPGDRDQLA